MAKLSFDQIVNEFRKSIRSRKRAGIVSAIDVGNTLKGVRGSSRGASMRQAFASLIEEGVLKATKDTVYNSDTHHSVTVYRFVGSRR